MLPLILVAQTTDLKNSKGLLFILCIKVKEPFSIHDILLDSLNSFERRYDKPKRYSSYIKIIVVIKIIQLMDG